MIITKSKDIHSILNSLNKYNKVAVLGCSECATVCRTGGNEEVEIMKEVLEDNNIEVPAAIVINTSCNDLTTKKDLRKIKKQLSDCEAVLSLACGNGVQTLAKFLDIPVYPGNNTLFVGERIRSGIFEENCRTCGDCVLGRTAAICPVSRCSKGLLNGACGGSTDGKCEINPEQDCAWVLIYNRLKDQDQLEFLEQIEPLRSYETYTRPRVLNNRKTNEK